VEACEASVFELVFEAWISHSTQDPSGSMKKFDRNE